MKIIYAGLAVACLCGLGGLAGQAPAQSTAPAVTPPEAPGNADALPPDSRFVPGDRIPNDFQADSFVVTTWQAEGLESPPNGYRWIRNDRGGQYLMASRTTGQIADAVDQAAWKKRRNPAVRSTDGTSPESIGTADRSWARGDHLGAGDAEAAVVADWQDAGLPRPQRGYHWVSLDNHFLLASRRTGLIKDVR